jgi:chromosome partitioning protein
MNCEPEEGEITIMELISEAISRKGGCSEVSLHAATKKNSEGVYCIPSDISLSQADMALAVAFSREKIVKRILTHPFFEVYFDYCLIDCPPNLGIVVINALMAADGVVIPVQTKNFAMKGLLMLEDAIEQVQQDNPTLTIEAVLLNMVRKNRNSAAIEAALKERYGDIVLNTTIPDLLEADTSTIQKRSLVNADRSRLGQLYNAAALELLRRMEG